MNLNTRRMGAAGILWCLMWIGAGVYPASGQRYPASDQRQDPVQIRELNHRLVQTPNVQMQTDGRPPAWRGRPSLWLQIECVFATQVDWLDELEFTYYVLMRSADPQQPVRLLTHQVTYVHVPSDRANPHYSWLYVHPHVVQRYGRVEGVAVEIRSRGRPVAGEATSRDYRAWVEQLPAESGWLLTPDQTPFMLFAPSRLLMMKPN